MTRALELHGIFLGESSHLSYSQFFDLTGFDGSIGQSITVSESVNPVVFIGLGHRAKLSPANIVQALGSIASFNLTNVHTNTGGTT
jgi:hypothetical protein